MEPDSNNNVQEGWEDNNRTSTMVNISGPDAGEPANNGPVGVSQVWVTNWDYEPPPVMTIHQAGDVDWLFVAYPPPHATIELETIHLSGGMDSVMELWVIDHATLEFTLVAIDDDSGTEPGASAFTYKCDNTANMSYLIRVYHKDPNGTGFYWVWGDMQ